MKKSFYYFLFAAATVSFYSCSSNDEPIPDPDPDPVESVDTSSFFILGRGSSYAGIDGSLSYYDYSSEDYVMVKESLTVFKDSNERSLGLSPNDMALYGGKLYIITYESATMEIVDINTMKSVKQYEFGVNPHSGSKSMPRHIEISGGKAYITTYDGYLARYDCATDVVDGFTAYLGPNPEGVAIAGDNIYVAISGGMNSVQGLPYDERVAIINKSTFDIKGYITVGTNPTDIVTNGTDVFVTCMGDYTPNGVKPMIWRIYGEKSQGYVPGTLMAIKDRQLYVINAPWDSPDPISYKCYMIDNSDDNYDFIEKGEGVDYPSALAVDRMTGNIIIGSATMDGQYPSWSKNGYYKMFTSDGKKVLRGETGIDPAVAIFVPKSE
ncbi:MAG: hypothetical protein K2H32_09655 [Muribaculaceae bacterium]|nr:hypothetical protein [Muribaculaceae bacterium]MDE7155174.1 hypothetical protein [Muribaculaceae bacterium]MDE7368371.1 hypothetical protein [Muribaculaceae bacterium]